MYKFILLLLSIYIPFKSYLQAPASTDKFVINGFIKDSLTGETIIGASVTLNGKSTGVVSNSYGFYSLTLDKGNYLISFSHVSYLGKTVEVKLTENLTLNAELIPRASLIEEVKIFSRKRDGNITQAQMGKTDLSIRQIKNVPALMGEIDLMKVLQLLPGVRNAGEGNAGFYVRGGSPDQNLIILDDAVVYNPGHLFGFFSVFNSDAIKNVSLIKGGMPAQYGGRISSVVDIAMKEGNMNQFQVDGGVGLVASRLSVQGPLKRNISSFIVSARRTYIDAIVKPFINKNSSFYGSGYFFYDLNAKVNYRFSEKDRLFLSGYFGRDVFDFVSRRRSFRTNIPWGNSTATMRWNHVFNRRLFANTTLVYNDYNFRFSALQENIEVGLQSGIRDVSVKTDFDYFPMPQHRIRFGGMFTSHKFIPNIATGRQDSVIFNPNNEKTKYALESALYVQDDWEPSERWKINYGVRYSRFTQTGPYTTYVRDIHGNKLDSTVFPRLKPVKNYQAFEPRLTIRYKINNESSLKAAITRNFQYIHLVSNSGNTLPTDLWVPSTYIVRPQISWQYAAGYFRNFNNNTWETSLELYYKEMQNQIDYKEGYTPSLKDPEEEFVFGKGWSYGAELFVNKLKGKMTGWLGYTLSWTWRRFPQLNEGEKFPARYDRRHDLSLVVNYDFNPKWKFGSVFVYGTGNAITLPERFYFISGTLIQEFSRINQYRMKAYHRLDLSATYTPQHKPGKKIKSYWVFSIYNVYSRLNPYFIYFDQTGSLNSGDLKVEARQVSLFPVIPSVSWNFNF